MALNHAVTLRIARDPHSIVEFQRLLFHTYCIKMKWHDPERFPDGIFRDEYDPSSVFLTIHEESRLVGGTRLVYDSERGFPHEELSRVSLPEPPHPGVPEKMRECLRQSGRTRIMEVTRFIAEPSARRIHTYDLMKAIYWYGINHGIGAYFMVVDMQTFLLCHKLGFSLVPIGIPLFCEGSWTIPATMIVEDMANLKTEVREYFLSTDNLEGSWIPT